MRKILLLACAMAMVALTGFPSTSEAGPYYRGYYGVYRPYRINRGYYYPARAVYYNNVYYPSYYNNFYGGYYYGPRYYGGYYGYPPYYNPGYYPLYYGPGIYFRF